MSDTPRTDEREALSEGLHEGWGLTLARQLERELNATKSDVDILLERLIDRQTTVNLLGVKLVQAERELAAMTAERDALKLRLTEVTRKLYPFLKP